MTNHYLGYPTHLDWLAAINRAEPVNALSVIHPGSSAPMGVSLNQHLIILSQVSGNTVHYLRLVTDVYQTMDGHNPLGDAQKHERRAETGWEIIQAWLAEQGLTVRRAILAFPKHIRLLDGHADGLMAMDTGLGDWVREDRIDPAVLDAWGVPRPIASPMPVSA